MIRIFCIIFCIPITCSVIVHANTPNLNDFNTYAQHLEQFPATPNLNWTDSDYTELHSKLMPNIIEKVLEKLNIKRPAIVTVKQLSELLNTATSARKKEGLEKKSVAVLTCNKKSTIYSWGALHGAFHGLVHALNWLRDNNVINDSLIITKPDHFFVFSGDAINQSAYSLETLVLILTLMIQNPNKVIYIQGTQETEQYWRNYGLKRQLQIRGLHFSNEIIPCGDSLDSFFATLPEVLYITHTQSSDKAIVFYPPAIKEINHPCIDGSYLQQTNTVGLHAIPKRNAKKTSPTPLRVTALIRQENALKDGYPNKGVALVPQIFGMTCWTIRSASITAYKEYLNFAQDCFAVITTDEEFDKSTIHFCHADPNTDATQKPFTQDTAMNLITGRLVTQHPSWPVGPDIVLGSSMSLEQGIPIVGLQAKEGIDIAVNAQNQKGGIDGRHIRLDIRYDKFNPNITRKNIDNLLEQGTDLIICPIGDPNLLAYLDLITNGDVLVLFPISGSPKFRKPDQKGIVHISATFADGVKNMVEYVIKKYNSNHFAFFYQNDDAGFEPINTAQTILKKHNITKWLDLPYTRGNINFIEQAQEVKNSQVDTIGLFSTSFATKEFIRQLDTETINNKIFFGSFLLGDEPFLEFCTRYGFHVILGARVPNPFTSVFPIVQEYRTLMDSYHSSCEVFSLETYIATRFTFELMLAMENEINHVTLREKIEAVKNYDFGGYTFTFDPETRTLGHSIWLTIDNDEWLYCDTSRKTEIV